MDMGNGQEPKISRDSFSFGQEPIVSMSIAQGSFVTTLWLKVCATDADAIRTTESASGPAAFSRAAPKLVASPSSPAATTNRGRIRWADTASSPKVNFMRYWPG